MAIVIIDILGDEEEKKAEPEEKEGACKKPSQPRPRLQKQVITIDGKLVSL